MLRDFNIFSKATEPYILNSLILTFQKLSSSVLGIDVTFYSHFEVFYQKWHNLMSNVRASSYRTPDDRSVLVRHDLS